MSKATISSTSSRWMAPTRASGGEPMQERLLGFDGRAFEEVPVGRGKDRLKKTPRFRDFGSRHFEDQMVLISVPVVRHALGKMPRKQLASHLHDLVAQIARQKSEAAGERVEPALDREQRRQPTGP